MTIVSQDQITRFRQRLFYEKAPELMKKGGQGLAPAVDYEQDDRKRWIIPTEAIISFFFEAVQDQTAPAPDRYIANLYTLFSVFSRDLDAYTFVSDHTVSEKDIQEAEDATTIQYLTRNLIINFFDRVKETGFGSSSTLLDKGLTTLIKISGQGRDYRSLAENTLANLTQHLGRETAWRPCLTHMNTAALVCTLVGIRLPKVDTEVISKFILQARSELEKEILLFDKLVNTRARAIQTPNTKAILKMTDKLDTALLSVLSNLEDFLSHARQFSRVLGIPLSSFLGKHDDQLKEILARQFFGHPGPESNEADPPLTYAGIRFRMAQLFQYDDITRFCADLKEHPIYGPAFLNLYTLCYAELVQSLEKMATEDQGPDPDHLRIRLFEFSRLFDRYGRDKNRLKPAKEQVNQSFITLFDHADTAHLPDLMGFIPDVARIGQCPVPGLLKPIREKLLTGCHRALFALEFRPEAPDAFETAVRKTLLGYAIHYKPQRIFYQRFFDDYVGEVGRPPSSYLLEKAKKHKVLIITLLRFLSDARLMANLLPKSYCDHAAQLLKAVKAA